jgi:hypothetical protein
MASKLRGASVSRSILAATAALALLTVGLAGPADAARLKYKQPTCGKLKKKVNKSTGAKKRAAKRALKRCKANRQVYKQIRNSHFYGYRTDDVKIDTIYCANGKWQDDVERDGTRGTRGWRVIDAKVRNRGRNLSAIVEAWLPGGRYVQGVIRKGDQWQVGFESSGKIQAAGDVEKRPARARCATL